MTSTPTFVNVGLPDIAVTAGEQLAIVLSQASSSEYVWDGDVNWPSFGDYPGTYTGGQGFVEGNSARVGPTCSNPSTGWVDLCLYNSPSAPVGGGSAVDFGFETFVDPSPTPEPSSIALLGTVGGALVFALRRKRAAI